jgi:hypothetical protein
LRDPFYFYKFPFWTILGPTGTTAEKISSTDNTRTRKHSNA